MYSWNCIIEPINAISIKLLIFSTKYQNKLFINESRHHPFFDIISITKIKQPLNEDIHNLLKNYPLIYSISSFNDNNQQFLTLLIQGKSVNELISSKEKFFEKIKKFDSTLKFELGSKRFKNNNPIRSQLGFTDRKIQSEFSVYNFLQLAKQFTEQDIEPFNLIEIGEDFKNKIPTLRDSQKFESGQISKIVNNNSILNVLYSYGWKLLKDNDDILSNEIRFRYSNVELKLFVDFKGSLNGEELLKSNFELCFQNKKKIENDLFNPKY